MSTHDTTNPLVRWATPAVAVVIGVAYLVGGLLGGDPGFGIFGLLLMLAVGAGFVLVSRHSETVAGLRDRRDERINGIDESATLFAGMTVILATIVMFVVEIAQGEDGSPYYQLGALGGVGYLVALVWLRLRR
jgi:hypothetical protein